MFFSCLLAEPALSLPKSGAKVLSFGCGYAALRFQVLFLPFQHTLFSARASW